MARHETSRSAIITNDRKEASSSGPHGLPWDLTIRDHYDRPKGGFNFRSSWLTMRSHDPWSLWPTKRRLQLQVLMAHHETSRSVIIMADRKVALASPMAHHETSQSVIIMTDRKVASASGPHGSPWDLTIRDHYDRPKGGFKFRFSWLTMRPHDPWSLRPTERWLQLQVLMAHHETSRSVIMTVDRKAASSLSPHGSP